MMSLNYSQRIRLEFHGYSIMDYNYMYLVHVINVTPNCIQRNLKLWYTHQF